MESMTTREIPEETDERLLEAKARLRIASVELNKATEEYLAAIALHIAVVAEIRDWHES